MDEFQNKWALLEKHNMYNASTKVNNINLIQYKHQGKDQQPSYNTGT